jgi:hypothetical protein
VARNTKIGKPILLDFALNYGRLVHDPDNFDSYYLQQSAGALNTRLQSNIDALNQDMEEIFVVPTLDRIRLIVAEFCDVEYAQVGRTTVATLSGAQSVVSAGSVNTFDFIRPLRNSTRAPRPRTNSARYRSRRSSVSSARWARTAR